MARDYRPLNSFAYRVKNGDSWVSIAGRLGMTPKALLLFNFNTDHPPYVNYYLHHNVGCKAVSADGKNYSFTNADPGVIYHPAFPPVLFFGGKEGGSGLDPTDDFRRHSPHDLMAFEPASNKDVIRVQAAFFIHFVLKSHVLDPSRFVYRQYIRGKNRVQREDGRWFDIPVMVPDKARGYGIFRRWDEVKFLEDGALENGVVGMYGYREAPAKPHDQYFATQKTGASYEGFDIPGFDVPKTNLREYRLDRNMKPIVPPGPPSGHFPVRIESTYQFKGRIVELAKTMLPHKIWADMEWEFHKRWKITNRYDPLKLEEY